MEGGVVTPKPTERRTGLVHLESWAGHSTHKVTILKETEKRYVCRWDDQPAFRHATGDIIRPPKHAVVITELVVIMQAGEKSDGCE